MMTAQPENIERTKKNPDLKGTGYELFILLLSVVSIINLALVVLGPWLGMNQKLLEVIYIINGILTLFFIIDFSYRFFTTDSKKNYFFKIGAGLTCWPVFPLSASSGYSVLLKRFV
ncbi:MAG: hypothetical protein M5U34_20850 [Chloroflexi bacterium]|nr:hypothetical protein [Chloroflexota bacterium]